MEEKLNKLLDLFSDIKENTEHLQHSETNLDDVFEHVVAIEGEVHEIKITVDEMKKTLDEIKGRA